MTQSTGLTKEDGYALAVSKESPATYATKFFCTVNPDQTVRIGYGEFEGRDFQPRGAVLISVAVAHELANVLRAILPAPLAPRKSPPLEMLGGPPERK